MTKRHGRRERGMTLIEIMVVVTILGLIATAIGVTVLEQLEAARRERARLDIHDIDQALQLYRVRFGRLPDTRAGVAAVVEAGILPAEPVDPWHQPYGYELNGNVARITSYGADGAPGGEGSDADITGP